MADFNYTGGVRFAPDKVVDVTADKDGNPTKACNPITGVCLEGGGDSDFSTAEVTIKATTLGTDVMLAVPDVIDELNLIKVELIDGFAPVFDEAYHVPLYKNKLELPTVGFEGFSVDCTGNIEYQNGKFNITGDGTITINPAHD